MAGCEGRWGELMGPLDAAPLPVVLIGAGVAASAPLPGLPEVRRDARVVREAALRLG